MFSLAIMSVYNTKASPHIGKEFHSHIKQSVKHFQSHSVTIGFELLLYIAKESHHCTLCLLMRRDTHAGNYNQNTKNKPNGQRI